MTYIRFVLLLALSSCAAPEAVTSTDVDSDAGVSSVDGDKDSRPWREYYYEHRRDLPQGRAGVILICLDITGVNTLMPTFDLESGETRTAAGFGPNTLVVTNITIRQRPGKSYVLWFDESRSPAKSSHRLIYRSSSSTCRLTPFGYVNAQGTFLPNAHS